VAAAGFGEDFFPISYQFELNIQYGQNGGRGNFFPGEKL
jgi:hypothetical protein